MSFEHLDWLKKKEMWHLAENNVDVFDKIMKKCMNLTSSDKVVIFSDTGRPYSDVAPLMAGSYYLSALKVTDDVKILLQEPKKKGQDADFLIQQALKELPEKSTVIMAMSNQLGHLDVGKSFRKFCNANNHKFLSTTGIGSLSIDQYPFLMSALDIDYEKMFQKGYKIREMIDNADKAEIYTPNGTNISMDVSGMKSIANVGDYFEFGRGGNMPIGEVYVPPNGYKGVKGTIVIDGSMRYHGGTLQLDDNNKIKLDVADGRVVHINGKYGHLLDETFKMAEAKAKYPERVRHVCELGIGINPGASILGATIVDEKTLGTCHFAIGSNYWFGGAIRTIVHVDQVIKQPTIYLDGEKLRL